MFKSEKKCRPNILYTYFIYGKNIYCFGFMNYSKHIGFYKTQNIWFIVYTRVVSRPRCVSLIEKSLWIIHSRVYNDD